MNSFVGRNFRTFLIWFEVRFKCMLETTKILHTLQKQGISHKLDLHFGHSYSDTTSWLWQEQIENSCWRSFLIGNAISIILVIFWDSKILSFGMRCLYSSSSKWPLFMATANYPPVFFAISLSMYYYALREMKLTVSPSFTRSAIVFWMSSGSQVESELVIAMHSLKAYSQHGTS